MKIREAKPEDLSQIIEMLANDKLGKLREHFASPLPDQYVSAFEKISQDANQELIVVEDETGEIIGTLQLTFIQYLNYQGGIRAQIESVRVREDQTGRGIGGKLISWAAERAKAKGAHLVQLTSDKQRPDAIRFYEKLGFKASHEGFKLHFK
ncbi:MAG: GNAT family N-acetyltransferase [Cyclobacteriaceae bacterium]